MPHEIHAEILCARALSLPLTWHRARRPFSRAARPPPLTWHRPVVLRFNSHMVDTNVVNTINPRFWANVWQLHQTGSCISSGSQEMQQIEKAHEVVHYAHAQVVHHTGGDKMEHAIRIMTEHSIADKRKRAQVGSTRAKKKPRASRVEEAVYTAFCEQDDKDLYGNMKNEIHKWQREMAPLEPCTNRVLYTPPEYTIHRKIERKWRGGTAPSKEDSRLDFFVSHFCTPVPAKNVPPRAARRTSWQESPPPPARALSP